jgi:hypothetical protein
VGQVDFTLLGGSQRRRVVLHVQEGLLRQPLQ